MFVFLAGLLAGIVLAPITGLVAIYFGVTWGLLIAIFLLVLFVGLALGWPIRDAFFGNTVKTTRKNHAKIGPTKMDVVRGDTADPDDDRL